ncbi:MAG: hypothetical protein Q9195_005089 [Heterodermia aff. obscurata]
MRAALKLLANVKPGRFLEANNPTGLTGLFTHPSPRSTLLALYSEALDRLETLPEHSVYRQSTEAITRHRLSIVDSVKPEGYEGWIKASREKIEAHPEVFQHLASTDVNKSMPGDVIAFPTDFLPETDEREVEWDGERTEDDNASLPTPDPNKPSLGAGSGNVSWEPEPPLEATQIAYLETQIGGGLIEEVIEVAQGELKLINIMSESQVWEDLEEKPTPGQWEYFSRDQHTLPTQGPPVDKKS